MSGLPFSAVVGQDDAKLALLLAAGEPLLGGVLLRGDKGSAKTTLARGLAALLPGDAPFVELPLGATEDRVIGSVEAVTSTHRPKRSSSWGRSSPSSGFIDPMSTKRAGWVCDRPSRSMRLVPETATSSRTSTRWSARRLISST